MKPFRPPPARVTRTLLIACIGVQCLLLVLGPTAAERVILGAGLVPARVTGAVIGLDGAVPAPLTFLTHMFLHGGIVHLAMNMMFLAWVGQQVEWAAGPVRLSLLFLAGGVAGGLLQVAVTPASTVPIVGASGGISAVFAAYALLFATAGEAPARILGVRISGEMVRALRYAALWIGLQLLTAVAFDQPGGNGLGVGGIAIWTHIGGFVAGLLLGLPLVRGRSEADFRD
jgi:membrane associated rhomboid family serine protease